MFIHPFFPHKNCFFLYFLVAAFIAIYIFIFTIASFFLSYLSTTITTSLSTDAIRDGGGPREGRDQRADPHQETQEPVV